MNWAKWHIPLSAGQKTLRQGLESIAEDIPPVYLRFGTAHAGPMQIRNIILIQVSEYSKISHEQSSYPIGCRPEEIATIYVETEMTLWNGQGLRRRNPLVPVDYVMCSLLDYYLVENKQAGFFGHPK
jgi:hypothetical protein